MGMFAFTFMALRSQRLTLLLSQHLRHAYVTPHSMRAAAAQKIAVFWYTGPLVS